ALEGGEVGVVAGRAAVAEHDGVDGAERRGGGRAGGDVRDGHLFARMRDVYAAEAEVARRAQEGADPLGPEPERREVDALVGVPETEALGFALVQRRRQRRADVGADQADEVTTSHGSRSLSRPEANVRTSTLFPGSHGPKRRARRIRRPQADKGQ